MKLMEEIYSDIYIPAGFASIEKLYREIKTIDNEVTNRRHFLSWRVGTNIG